MIEKLKKDELLSELDQLHAIFECPRLYLASYFSDLKADVDIELVKKQQTYQKNAEIIEKLAKIWKNIISKIESFEKNCICNKLDAETKDSLEAIKAILNDEQTTISLEKVKEEISNEKYRMLKQLFQNKTITFVNVENILPEYERELIDCKLVLLSDEFISHKKIKQR